MADLVMLVCVIMLQHGRKKIGFFWGGDKIKERQFSVMSH